MTAEDGKDGHKYEWQSWPPDSLEGMPPKRRRLVAWGFLWFLIVGWLFGEVLEAAGIAQPWRTLLTIAGLAGIFVPLIGGAVLEARQLRAEGIELPSYPVTRKTLITNAIITGVAWLWFVVFTATGQPLFIVLPIACTMRLLSVPAVEGWPVTEFTARPLFLDHILRKARSALDRRTESWTQAVQKRCGPYF